MALINGLISYYKLDESSGNAIDSHSSNHGNVVGATQGVSGKINTAYSFDGNDYIYSTSTDFVIGFPLTVSAWFKTSSANAQRIVSKPVSNNAHQRYVITMNAGVLTAHFSIAAGTGEVVTASGTWNDGAWHHVVYTRNATHHYLYVDGNLEDSNTHPGTIFTPNPEKNFVIGARHDDGIYRDFFIGKIDEIYIGREMFDSAQVSAMWNNGNGSSYPFEVVPQEGFLEITGITAPTKAHQGDLINFTIHTKNTGATDNFRVELSGDLTGSQEFSLGEGLTKDAPFSFIMPLNDISIIINTYHLTEEGDWVWDVSSVWDVNRWN